MKLRHFISTVLCVVILLIPTTVLAVDFDITDVKIDVHLTEEGDAHVVEEHTYAFDSKFNGITREIFPKKDSQIINFEAFEGSTPLKVEREEQLYKIYRSGKNETVNFQLHYTITDTIEKFEDGAQFYYAFFSARNESDYGNMKITIHPPKKAVDVDFLGYDAAYEKGERGMDGVVTFSLGPVPAHENGDVRVIYEPSLFPFVEMKSGLIRHEIVENRVRIAEEKAAFLASQEKIQLFGMFAVSTVFISFLSLFAFMFGKRRRTQYAVLSQLESVFVPHNELSMPATIQYTSPLTLGSERISAALLDLIRQGYVKQLDGETFELVNVAGVNDHEASLIDLLFLKVGNGERFSLDDLEHYTKNKLNHKSYSEGLQKWRNGILQEVKDAQLSEKKVGLRIAIALFSIALVPVIMLLANYALYPLMVILIFFVFIGVFTALLYSPRSVKGMEIYAAWKRLRKKMEKVSMEEWEQLSANDKYRAYIYGIGVKDARLNSLYEQFERAEQRTGNRLVVGGDAQYVYYNPAFLTSGFASANKNASVSADGSIGGSSIGSGGGGVGGSGGGSGAF